MSVAPIEQSDERRSKDYLRNAARGSAGPNPPEESLPPGAGTKDHDDPPGTSREAAPFEEEPAEGRLSPEADNPPPAGGTT